MSGELTVGERGVPTTSEGSPPEGWRLDVTEGPNRGAGLVLPPGSYRIGDHAEADVMLADPAAGHPDLTLVIPDSGPATLRAASAGATFGGRPLEPGASRTVPRGGEVRLGATAIRLTAPPALVAQLEGRRRTLRRGVAAGVAALLAVIAVGAFGPRLLSDSRPPPPTGNPAVAVQPSPAPPNREAARADLAARLEAAGLGGDRLRVTDGANGAIVVEGRLTPEETSRFADVRKWYDAAYGAGPTLLPQLGTDIGPARPALRIRAVALSPVPYVIAWDGERYGEGSVLENGWVIESIGADRVVLRRGSETSVVTL